MSKFTITFQPENKKVQVNKNTTILEAAVSAGLDLTGPCGGKCKCGKCKVRLRSGSTTVSKQETEILSEESVNSGYRLACNAKIVQDLVVEIPIETRITTQKIFTVKNSWKVKIDEYEEIKNEIQLSPKMKKVYLELSEPSLEDNISDLERLKKGLEASYSEFKDGNFDIPLSVLKKLSIVLRDSNWKITITIVKMNNVFEIINIEPGDTSDLNFGLAFDIGTSTIVGYLLNLATGEEHSVASAINPQGCFGEDVITRIDFALKNKNNGAKLQYLLNQTINQIIKTLISESPAAIDNIHELVVVGNTCMHHLFLNLDTKGCATAPYIPSIAQPLYTKARKLELKINPEGYVYSMPIVAGFLGADAVAVTLVSGMADNDAIKLNIDLGTNGEIILGSNARILGCSTAAGPAFEGGHLKHGTRAVAGAIDKIRILEDDPSVIHFSTINNTKPLGITGSGLVDAAAELLRIGIIERSGKFDPDLKLFQERMVAERDNPEFVLVEGKSTQTCQPITITQKDIRELQLAKAAIYAGIQILLQELGIKAEEITELLIAGAFGNYINKSSAIAIKIIPDLPLGKIHAIGNAAGKGARAVLLSTIERARAEALSKKIEYIELSERAEFQDLFVNAMGF